MSIRTHGALGAAHLEVAALREQLARAGDFQDAIDSFVGVIREQVVLVGERNAALAQVAAVRALCDELETSTGRLSVVQVAASIRAALDADGAGSHPAGPPVRPGAVLGTRVTPDPPSALRSPPTEGAP